jgi:hypothetical protein
VSSYDYRFETHWRVPGRLEEVTEILSDAPSLTRWWPKVYLAISEPEPGVFALRSRGWLPYVLSWNLRMVESRAPFGFTIQAWGDLEGTGVWTFDPDGDWTRITYVWKVRAHKPLLRNLSLLLKPLFSANHRWAMARGQESLVRELSRRQQEKVVRTLNEKLCE